MRTGSKAGTTPARRAATGERGSEFGPGMGGTRIGAILVLLVTLVALLPFLSKAYTIDDTLFLWLAQHIQSSPLDFFGFDVNWYGTPMRMHEVTKNPPLVGYLIAATAWLHDYQELRLHAVFLLPALAAALGTWSLARRLCAHPLEAALVGILTPVFLVSATSVMSDISMLALWCWSLRLWLAGMDAERQRPLLASALLLALAGLTKYFAIALLPLLFADGLIRRRRLGRWALPLLIPLVVFVAYDLGTQAAYGRGMITDAASYATEFDEARPGFGARALVGLGFAGGCLVPALLLAPLLWRRRALVAGALLFVGLLAAHWSTESVAGVLTESTQALLVQRMLMIVGGVSVLALAAAELRRAPTDPDRWLLALWILGTFAFASFVNWVNNGRSNLPMAPALGILIVRQIAHLRATSAAEREASRRAGASESASMPTPDLGLLRPGALALVVPAALLAWSVAFGDARWANVVRSHARQVCELFGAGPGRLLYEGHWGFQYYMDALGAVAVDTSTEIFEPGDRLALPSNNVDVWPPPGNPQLIAGLDRIQTELSAWTPHTLNRPLRISFYASNLGALPFGFAASPPETVVVIRILRQFGFPAGKR